MEQVPSEVFEVVPEVAFVTSARALTMVALSLVLSPQETRIKENKLTIVRLEVIKNFDKLLKFRKQFLHDLGNTQMLSNQCRRFGESSQFILGKSEGIIGMTGSSSKMNKYILCSFLFLDQIV